MDGLRHILRKAEISFSRNGKARRKELHERDQEASDVEWYTHKNYLRLVKVTRYLLMFAMNLNGRGVQTEYHHIDGDVHPLYILSFSCTYILIETLHKMNSKSIYLGHTIKTEPLA